MMKNRYRINVPQIARLGITVKDRKKAFKEIYEGYTKIYNVKLLYAYLNYDTEKAEKIDYCVIYKARNDENTGDLILFDSVVIHSDRSTPCYDYYRETGNKENFFQFGIEEMVTMGVDKFYEFLVRYLELSLDKDDDKYWKNKKYAPELANGLLDLSLQYVKKESPITSEEE